MLVYRNIATLTQSNEEPQSHQRDAERLQREQELMRACMRDRGYALVPAQKR